MIMKYIKQDQILSFDFDLDSKYNIGSSYEDYVAGKYVKLSDAQVKFYENNPSANISEVWNMAMVSHERTLEQAKAEKTAEIERFDETTNEFSINGFSMWLDSDRRRELSARLDTEEAAGRTTTNLPFELHTFTMPISTMRELLQRLNLYAIDCFDVTQSHKIKVAEMTTVEEVMNYDYKTGYPNKLEFK